MGEKKEPFFKRLKKRISDIINVFRQIKLDDEYYKQYIEGMRKESQTIDSKFAAYDLKISDDNKFITYLITLPPEFKAASDYLIYQRLNDDTVFITEYLRKYYGLGMYVSIPEFYRVEDPTNPNVISMTYIAQWTFQPVIDKETKHKYCTRLYAGITGLFLLTAAVVAAIIIF